MSLRMMPILAGFSAVLAALQFATGHVLFGACNVGIAVMWAVIARRRGPATDSPEPAQ